MRSNLMRARLIMYLTGGFMLFFTLSLISAPLFFPQGSINFGEGSPVGSNDFQEERDRLNMSGYLEFLYWQGDINCNQIASRSFFLNGNQMPVCARCLAIYAGISGGILFSTRKRPYLIKGWGLILGIIPMGVDGGVQLLGFYESNNLIRVITGLLGGGTVGLALGMIILDIFGHYEGEKHRSEPGSAHWGVKMMHNLFKKVIGDPSPGDVEFFFICMISLILVVINIVISLLSRITNII